MALPYGLLESPLTVAVFGLPGFALAILELPVAVAILELTVLLALALSVDICGLLWLPVYVPVGFTFAKPWVPPCVLPVPPSRAVTEVNVYILAGNINIKMTNKDFYRILFSTIMNLLI